MHQLDESYKLFISEHSEQSFWSKQCSEKKTDDDIKKEFFEIQPPKKLKEIKRIKQVKIKINRLFGTVEVFIKFVR